MRLRWVVGVLSGVAMMMPMAAVANPIAIFDVSVRFADGNQLTGTVTTQAQDTGFVDEDLVYRSATSTALATFTGQGELIPFLGSIPTGPFPPKPPYPQPTTTAIVSPGAAGDPYQVSLIVPTGVLADWLGGSVCLVGSGCYQGLYTTALTSVVNGYGVPDLVSEPAVSGSFTRESAPSPVPEPGTLGLLVAGATAGAGVLRGRLRRG